jgi:hypothetical protein
MRLMFMRVSMTMLILIMVNSDQVWKNYGQRVKLNTFSVEISLIRSVNSQRFQLFEEFFR